MSSWRHRSERGHHVCVHGVERAPQHEHIEAEEGDSASLQRALTGVGLSADVLHEIRSNTIRLGALEPPFNLDASTSAMIRAAISKAFLFGFRLVMLICAGLSAASSAAAWLMIPRGWEPRTDE